jgi:hypothetical protein
VVPLARWGSTVATVDIAGVAATATTVAARVAANTVAGGVEAAVAATVPRVAAA